MKIASLLVLCAVTASAERQWVINHGRPNDNDAEAFASANGRQGSSSGYAARAPRGHAFGRHNRETAASRTTLETKGFDENARAPSTHTFRSSLSDEAEEDYVDSLLGSLDGNTQVISNGYLTDAVEGHADHDLKWAVFSETDGLVATGQDVDVVQALLEASHHQPIDPWHETEDEHAFIDEARRRVYRRTGSDLLEDSQKPAHHHYNVHSHALLDQDHQDPRDLLRDLRDAIDAIVADED